MSLAAHLSSIDFGLVPYFLRKSRRRTMEVADSNIVEPRDTRIVGTFQESLEQGVIDLILQQQDLQFSYVTSLDQECA